MLDIGNDTGSSPACFYTHVRLPKAVDLQQPSRRKKPFSCVLNTPFSHRIDVIGPSETVRHAQSRVQKATGQIRYAQVCLKLKDIITGDFFSTYIKTGNVSMLAEGREGVDNTYSLHDGILRLNLDKPTYERAGLGGKPVVSPGRKHSKSRYLVELNLRLPSMVRGRPGFNRIVYALENVLVESRTWLFYDLRNPQLVRRSSGVSPPSVDDETRAEAAIEHAAQEPQPAPAATNGLTELPILAFQPKVRSLETGLTPPLPVRCPEFPLSLDETDKIEATEWLEWLNLAMLDADGLRPGETMDSTINRYHVPDLLPVERNELNGDIDGQQRKGRGDGLQAEEEQASTLARLHVRGFVCARVAHDMLLRCLRLDDPRQWLAVRFTGIGGATCMVFARDGQVHVWEY